MNLQKKINVIATKYIVIGISAFVITLIVWHIAKTTQGINLELWLNFSLCISLGIGLFTGLLFGLCFPIEEKEIVRMPLLVGLLLACVYCYIGITLIIASENFLPCLLLYLGTTSTHFFCIGISYFKKSKILQLC